MKFTSLPSLTVLASALLCAAAASAAPRGDTDGDGKLSLTEYQTQMHTRFMRADKNGDGKLSLDEWLARPAAAKAKGDPSAQFKRLDTNSDGFLDTAEIDLLAKRRFEMIDANHDGAISDEEWAARPKNATTNNADSGPADEEPSAEKPTTKQ